MGRAAEVGDDFGRVTFPDFFFFQVCAVLGVVSVAYCDVSVVYSFLIQVSNGTCCSIKIVISAKAETPPLVILFLYHFHISNSSNSLLELNEVLLLSRAIKWYISKKDGGLSTRSHTVKFLWWIQRTHHHLLLATTWRRNLMHPMHLRIPWKSLRMLLRHINTHRLWLIIALAHGRLHHLSRHPPLARAILGTLMKYLNVIIIVHLKIIHCLLVTGGISHLISWLLLNHLLSLLFRRIHLLRHLLLLTAAGNSSGCI